MGFVRTAYTAPARFTVGGPVSKIRWYLVPDDTPRYMGANVFGPLSRELGYRRTEAVGELTTASRRRHNGDPPPGDLEGMAHGTPADFRGERVYAGPPEFEELPPCVQDRLIKRAEAVAPAEIILEQLTDVAFPDIGFSSEIILESIWTTAEEAGEEGCDLLLWGSGDLLLWDDLGAIEIDCPTIDLLLWGDGDYLEWDDGGFIPIT